MLLVMMCTMIGVCANASWADDIDDLRKEMQKLRSDYESKIKKLQTQVNNLSKKQDREIDKLEEKVDKSTVGVDYVGRYDGAFKRGGLVLEHSGFGKVTLGGYMDHEYEDFENAHSNFDQHRWILNIGAELGDRLRFYSEYEIEHGGPNASGGGEAKVEQAWVDFLIEDWVNLRAGALLVPFGRTNLYHDSDIRDLTTRPIVSRDIIPTTWTESGVGIHGEVNPTIGSYEDLAIGYETYIINGLTDGFSDTSMSGAKGSLGGNNNNNQAVVGRVAISPLLGHEIAFSGYWGKYDTKGNAISGQAVDMSSTVGPFELVGEYAHFNVDEPDYVAGLAAPDIAKTFQGYRAQLNYHFWPEFLDDTFLGRGFEDPTFTLINRFGWARIDDDNDADAYGVAEANTESRYTLGLNYRPVESMVFKIEHLWNRNENDALEYGSNNGFTWSVAMGF